MSCGSTAGNGQRQEKGAPAGRWRRWRGIGEVVSRISDLGVQVGAGCIIEEVLAPDLNASQR